MIDKHVFLEQAAWSLEMLAKCIREEDIKTFDKLTYLTDEVDEADNQICVNVDLCEVREILKEIFMSEWQPIETAPTDGRKIIVFGGYFDTNDQSFGMRVDPDGCEVFTSRAGRFFLNNTTADEIRNATHWQELDI